MAKTGRFLPEKPNTYRCDLTPSLLKQKQRRYVPLRFGRTSFDLKGERAGGWEQQLRRGREDELFTFLQDVRATLREFATPGQPQVSACVRPNNKI